MVPPQQVNVVGILAFKCQQQSHHLNAEKTPIDIITKKQELVLGKVSIVFQNIEQVMKLSMDVAYDSNGGLQTEYVRLIVLIEE